jgi:putative tryptophan/tyrosine transport system substrate-binding protein
MNRRNHLRALAAFGLSPGLSAWPIAARAQQPRLTRIGVLLPANPEPLLGLLRDALRERGYVEGENVQFTVRSAGGKPDLSRGLADELVRLPVDIIVVWQTPAAFAASQATTQIPIVMGMVADPVGSGLVASLARPGGNITGLAGTTAELGAKILQLIREALPATRRVAILANATDPFTKTFVAQIELAGQALGIATQTQVVRGVEDYEGAFAAMKKERTDAVIVQPSLPRKPAIELALKQRLPAMSPSLYFTGEGGLLSYAANLDDSYRRTAHFVERILKGAKPADLPVEQPTRFELRVNLVTAKALGISIPQSFLLRADEVIR